MEDAIAREIKTLKYLTAAKNNLFFVQEKFNNPIEKPCKSNWEVAVENINNMIIQIAENIAYLQVEKENETESEITE